MSLVRLEPDQSKATSSTLKHLPVHNRLQKKPGTFKSLTVQAYILNTANGEFIIKWIFLALLSHPLNS